LIGKPCDPWSAKYLVFALQDLEISSKAQPQLVFGDAPLKVFRLDPRGNLGSIWFVETVFR
jgi:hypothetical protein